MSYLARLAARSVPGALPSTSHAVPAMRSGSPVAAVDQRFNLSGFAGSAHASSTPSVDDAGELSDVDSEQFESVAEPARAAPAPSVTPSHHAADRVEVARFAAAPAAPGAAQPAMSRASSAEAPRAPSEQSASAPRVTPTGVTTHADVPRSPTGSEPRSPMSVPPAMPAAPRTESVARAQVADSPTAARSPSTPSGIRAEGPVSAPVLPSPSASPSPAPSPQPLAQNTAFPATLRDALAKVEAWMRADATPPASPEPAAPVRAQASPLAFAPQAASAFSPPAPPRLNIGHIEVEVIAPSRQEPPRAQRRPAPVVVAARSSSFDSPFGKHTFGLRQR